LQLIHWEVKVRLATVFLSIPKEIDCFKPLHVRMASRFQIFATPSHYDFEIFSRFPRRNSMAGKEKFHGGHFPKYIVLQAVFWYLRS